jgi:hypothetical protein
MGFVNGFFQCGKDFRILSQYGGNMWETVDGFHGKGKEPLPQRWLLSFNVA